MNDAFFGRSGRVTTSAPVAPAQVSASAIQAQAPGQPLDRAAAVVYGDFVMLAYEIFGTPSSANFAIPTGYHVSAYIFMYDFVFLARRKKFYGFIATQDDDPYSHILVIRGTEGWWEWWDDAVFVPTTFQPVPEAGPVHSGFYRIYRTMALYPLAGNTLVSLDSLPHVPDPTATFADQLEAFLSRESPVPQDPGRHHHFIVTGHSLGAALCTLYVMEHAVKKLVRKLDRRVTIERVCTFASPRVATGTFVERFHTLPIDSWRIANSQDLVPQVPPEAPFGYRHVDDSYLFTSENTTRRSASCWHDMHTYQHWLDPARPIEPGCAI